MENEQIIKVLEELGVESDFLGFKCLYEMILLSQKQDENIALETNFPILVSKFYKNGTQIERAIRYVLYQMKKKQAPVYQRLFIEEPEISDFVSTINDYLNTQAS